ARGVRRGLGDTTLRVPSTIQPPTASASMAAIRMAMYTGLISAPPSGLGGGRGGLAGGGDVDGVVTQAPANRGAHGKRRLLQRVGHDRQADVVEVVLRD